MRLLLPACGALSLLSALSCGVLGLLCGPSGCLLGLARRLSSGVLYALGGLSGLPEHPSNGARGLIGDLSYGVLSLLFDLPGVLLRLLGSLVDYLFHPKVFCGLVDCFLCGHVGIDHLLDLGLCFLRRHLIDEALQLGAVPLQLTLEVSERVGVEVLGDPHGLISNLLG